MEEGGTQTSHTKLSGDEERERPKPCTCPLEKDGDGPGAQLSTGAPSPPSCKKLRNRIVSQNISRLWPSLGPYKVLFPQPLEGPVHQQKQSHIGHKLLSAYRTIQSTFLLSNRTLIYSWDHCLWK